MCGHRILIECVARTIMTRSENGHLPGHCRLTQEEDEDYGLTVIIELRSSRSSVTIAGVVANHAKEERWKTLWVAIRGIIMDHFFVYALYVLHISR